MLFAGEKRKNRKKHLKKAEALVDFSFFNANGRFRFSYCLDSACPALRVISHFVSSLQCLALRDIRQTSYAAKSATALIRLIPVRAEQALPLFEAMRLKTSRFAKSSKPLLLLHRCASFVAKR
ncbi:hypothetical protein DP120_13495 [Planococcus halotolerans]|uniref:Uncharacterized protein n=1 Tax=Planococcus halotolerans TaxID=2233542 RepID=A0A365KQI5_9BACL|nr:hypothetical protein DP120_13495 [Planococcus halotolerans]